MNAHQQSESTHGSNHTHIHAHIPYTHVQLRTNTVTHENTYSARNTNARMNNLHACTIADEHACMHTYEFTYMLCASCPWQRTVIQTTQHHNRATIYDIIRKHMCVWDCICTHINVITHVANHATCMHQCNKSIMQSWKHEKFHVGLHACNNA